jgi:DNA-binding NarL/FixJ family response regulator
VIRGRRRLRGVRAEVRHCRQPDRGGPDGRLRRDWIDGSLLGPILGSYRRSNRPPARYHSRLDAFTARELDVLRLMARGASNREIADELYLAETMIKTHVSALFNKFGARDRAAAIIFAYDAGLVRPRR